MDTLKNEQVWCLWRYEGRAGGSPSKIPYQVSGDRARSNAPETWNTFTEVRSASEAYSNGHGGMGFFFSRRADNPSFVLCGIDIDAHNGPDENPLSRELLDLFAGTYIERTPSGKGYHILCNVDYYKLPVDASGKLFYKNKNSETELEVYVGGLDHRYFTYTGDQVSEGNAITDQTDIFLGFLRQYIPLRKAQIRTEESETTHPPASTDVEWLHMESPFDSEEAEDAYIEERLRLARRLDKTGLIITLYDQGDISKFNNDDSKADFNLILRLRYWLGNYPTLINKAFCKSALYREKWDESRTTYGTYGLMTICNMLVIFSHLPIFIPPERAARGTSPSWSSVLDRSKYENIDNTIIPDPTIGGGQIKPEDVHQLINRIEKEYDTDHITVLPLMCGTGKSTAIRLKMQEVIESNDGTGMIVMTDKIDNINEYLNGGSEELNQFFFDYSNYITVMTHENLREAEANQSKTPILIMTTQRYTNLSRQQVEDYLKWDGGQRSLILVDEKPYFKKEISFNEDHLRRIRSAISMGIDNARDRDQLALIWDRLTDFYCRMFNSYRTSFTEDKQYYFYRILHRVLPEELAIARKLFSHYKNSINNYTQREWVDNYTVARAILQASETQSLIQIRVTAGRPSQLNVTLLLDNMENYSNLDAKVIVLDGTADLSAVYMLYDNLDTPNFENYKRSLERLTIKIVNCTTGKNSLRLDAASGGTRMNEILDYLRSVTSDGSLPVIFSYLDFSTGLISECGEDHFDWFGNIKGKNCYREEKCIAQIGVNRFPIGSYFLFQLEKEPETASWLRGFAHLNQNEEIHNFMKDINSFTKEAERREILADTEQNLFRGIIRTSNSDEPYVFYLFTTHRDHELITAIKNRYEPLGAHVELVNMPGHENDPLEKAMSTRFSDGHKSTFQRIVEWHDTQLQIGDIYTTNDVLEGAGIEKAQELRTTRQRHKTLDQLFRDEQLSGVSRTAKFEKRSNWYF